MLKESGVTYESREYFKDRFTKDELRSLLHSAHLEPGDLISTRSRPYKERNLGESDLDDEQMLDLMIEEPRLLRRPIVIGEDRVIVGHDEQALRDLIASMRR